MIKLVVRAKKDADALRACLSRFYGDWSIPVYTLKGVREADKVLDRLREIFDEESFIIVLLGREESYLKSIEDSLPLNVIVHVLPKARVRNTRIIQIAREIERAKSVLRTSVYWTGAYVFCHRVDRGVRLDIENEPAYDLFLGLGEGFLENLSRVLGERIPPVPLLVRKFGGEHDIFSGPRRVGYLKIPDEGEPSGEVLVSEFHEVELDVLLKSNAPYLEFFEKMSLSLLRKLTGFDDIIIPWSAGKDSTAALLLAVKAYGVKKITAIYVDTGVDFPCNLKYVETVSRKLGVRLEVAEAHVDSALEEKGLPTNENRWCTRMKIEALYRKIREASRGRTLIVVGDRDAESELRSKRPFVRTHEEFTQVAPLKLWSGSHVQLYLLKNNIPLNPLYLEGFYRLGCFICPALRSWEIMILKNNLKLIPGDQLNLFKSFLRCKGERA